MKKLLVLCAALCLGLATPPKPQALQAVRLAWAPSETPGVAYILWATNGTQQLHLAAGTATTATATLPAGMWTFYVIASLRGAMSDPSPQLSVQIMETANVGITTQ